MKIVQWNMSKKTQPMTGVKKYEDELYSNVETQKEIDLKRIRRANNVILGNTVASWFLTYKSGDADIVHATCQTIAPVALINKPKRFIVTVLDLIPLVYPSILGKDLSLMIQWLLTPKALERVDKIIVVSEFTKKEIVSLLGINEARICVIPLAVDHSKYYPKNKAECRRKFGLQENGKYILAVASNNENKGK